MSQEQVPTINDLLDLTREWVMTRDNIVAKHGAALTVLSSDSQFVRAMESFQARAVRLVGPIPFELFEGMTELLYMAKNSLPQPKLN